MALRLRKSVEDDQETKPDLTPMIDIIFLLLIFLILTTTFVQEEEVIHQLLPTENGSASTKFRIIEQTKVNFAVYPAGIDRSMSEAELQAFADDLNGGRPHAVVVRCLSEDITLPIQMDPQQALERIHAFAHKLLQQHEVPGTERHKQPPVVVHCYTGLAWSHALWVYDAAREYERQHGRPDLVEQGSWETFRELTMANPPLRDHSQRDRGRELKDLMVIR